MFAVVPSAERNTGRAIRPANSPTTEKSGPVKLPTDARGLTRVLRITDIAKMPCQYCDEKSDYLATRPVSYDGWLTTFVRAWCRNCSPFRGKDVDRIGENDDKLDPFADPSERARS